MLKRGILLLFILNLCGNIWCQETSNETLDYATILADLEESLAKGNKRSIRDIASLLDKPQHEQTVREILQQHTFFTKDEIDLNQTSKDQLLMFYYSNESSIQFSDIIGAFFLTPIEHQKGEYEPETIERSTLQTNALTIRQLVDQLEQAIHQKKLDQTLSSIQELAKIHTPKAFEILLEELENDRSKRQFGKDSYLIYTHLIAALEDFPTYETFKGLFYRLEDGSVNLNQITSNLAKLTNVFPPSSDNNITIATYYQQLLDSLQTPEAVRRFGYEQIFKFKANYFYEEIDYLGKILCLSNSHRWITDNVMTDLKMSHHSRSLFYLAAYCFKNRQHLSDNELKQKLEQLASLSGKSTAVDLNKRDEARQFLIYWARHYQDFEWSTYQNAFIDQAERAILVEQYDKLFRRLNSRNDSVALEAYTHLSQGIPEEVIKLARKYRPLLRSYNRKLPPLKNNYLDQLSLLTDFCEKNEINYFLSFPLVSILNQLDTLHHPSDRYLVENKLLRSTTLDDLTALEYFTFLNEKNKELNLSIGRVLDRFYAENWTTIIQQPHHIRLYLKKSSLYNKMGVTGLCTNYLTRFDVKNQNEQVLLKDLLRTEEDEDIALQIKQILVQNENETSNLQVASFIQYPDQFTRIEIKILPTPTTKEVETLVELILNDTSFNVRKKCFNYLSQHVELEHAKLLIPLLQSDKVYLKNEKANIRICERAVPIFEDIYDYSFGEEDQRFNPDPWRQLWRKDKKNLDQWQEQFLAIKLEKLQNKEEVSVDEVNAIIDNPAFNGSHKTLCLQLLPKIKPFKHIQRLNIDPKLSIATDLVYFENFEYTHKQLDDLPRLFDCTHPDSLIVFLERKSAHFEVDEKGSFYNDILKYDWFLEYILAGKLAEDKVENIKDVLEHYLYESDFLSEFEEQRTLLNITHLANIGRPLKDKLEASLALDADDRTKAKVQQEIIARIPFSEIQVVAEYLPYLSNLPGKSAADFLHRDFGLPIFHLNDDELTTLINRHQALSEYDFYFQYLKDFQLDFLTKEGQMDMRKIYDILRFDIVTPFAGNSGSRRDHYVYGIIKLLEINFQTRLGFHEKLNEAQTFYTYTSSKRSAAWQKYILDNDLLSANAPSTIPFQQISSKQ